MNNIRKRTYYLVIFHINVLNVDKQYINCGATCVFLPNLETKNECFEDSHKVRYTKLR